MSDLFPTKAKPTKPKAPTKELLTLWDAHLDELGVPRLTGGECSRLGRVMRTCWEMCRQDTGMVKAGINAYFLHPDAWTLEHGFPALGFMERFRGLLLKSRREEQRKRLEALREEKERILYGKNPPEDPTVAIEKVKADVAKFRDLARKVNKA